MADRPFTGLASYAGRTPAPLAARSSLPAITRSSPFNTIVSRAIGLHPFRECRAFAGLPGFGISTTLQVFRG